MAAIVTNNIKEQLLQTVLTDVADSANYYYIGIGRSDQWNALDTVPDLSSSEREERNFRTSLQSVIRTTDVSFVVPRYNWTSGSIYSAYDDSKTNAQNASVYPHYVLTDNQRVYICLRQGKTSTGSVVQSTVNPDTIGTPTSASKTSDGYIWKYLYTLSAVDASKFLSANYTPIQFVDSATTLTETTQKAVQDAAVAGEIVGYRVIDPGAGYSVTPSVTVNGDGSGAEAIASLTTANGIAKIEVKDSAGGIPFGSGYNFASVKLQGVTPTREAIIRPIIAKNGIGADPRDDLQASAIMFNAKPSGVQNNSFMVDQDFRQIGLFRSLKKNQVADSDFKGEDARMMNYLLLNSLDPDFDSAAVKDALITGVTSGAKARGDELKDNKLYYHFAESDGFAPFIAAEDVFLDSVTGVTANITLLGEAEVKAFSGELLYIENRSAVERNTAQTEDIKIIVQL